MNYAEYKAAEYAKAAASSKPAQTYGEYKAAEYTKAAASSKPTQTYGEYKVAEYTKAANTLGINDLTIGTSAAGAMEYFQELKTVVIDQACEMLDDTANLFRVFRESWQGQAENNFENNFKNATTAVKESLEYIKDNIESLISDLVEQWAQQDKLMINED